MCTKQTMKSLLNRLHARLGDLWWYSLMIFVACRSGDVIQAFIGLWLVPKYVGPEELGAVLPLQQLATFLTIPLAIIAVVFTKYVNTYATHGEYGKVKSFIRDVFITSGILFAICIGGAYLFMPFFYERLRVASGSLTLLILLCGLVANVGTIINGAQQGLKRFKTMSIMALIGAPIRLITLLVAMPFRALSGYVLGQTTPGATTSFLSAFDIHRALKPYAPDTSWRKDIPEIWRYLWPYAICTIIGSFAGAMMATVYRQRLPEAESAAYYLLTRFADMVGFIGTALSVILFPLAAEAHEKGEENKKLLWKTILGTMTGCIALTLIFTAIAKPLLSLTSVWQQYLPYAHLLPFLTFAIGPGLVSGAIANYDFACHRFTTTATLCVLNFTYAAFLVSFTGCEFFRGVLPDTIVDWMVSCDIRHLSTLTLINIVFNSFCALTLFVITTSRRTPKTSTRRFT